MTPSTQLREVEFTHTQPPDIELASMNDALVQVLPLPQAAPTAQRKTLGEFLTSGDTWRAAGQLAKRAATVGASVIGGTVAITADVISSLPWREFWRLGVKWFKLGVCVFLDILDFTIGRLLGFGILFDLGCALITAALWGKRGWWCLWEVIDITEQIDGFVPTCTLIALRSWNDE